MLLTLRKCVLWRYAKTAKPLNSQGENSLVKKNLHTQIKNGELQLETVQFVKSNFKVENLGLNYGKQSQKPSSSALIFAELTLNAGRLPYWWLAPLAFVVAPRCLFMTMLRYTKLFAHFASVYQASNFRQTLKPTCIHLFMHSQPTYTHTDTRANRADEVFIEILFRT